MRARVTSAHSLSAAGTLLRPVRIRPIKEPLHASYLHCPAKHHVSRRCSRPAAHSIPIAARLVRFSPFEWYTAWDRPLASQSADGTLHTILCIVQPRPALKYPHGREAQTPLAQFSDQHAANRGDDLLLVARVAGLDCAGCKAMLRMAREMVQLLTDRQPTMCLGCDGYLAML